MAALSAAPERTTYFSDGLRIVADLYRPAAADGPTPAIVFAPGYTGTRANPMYARWVGPLTAAGWSVLLPDYRGWGESEGERGAIYPLDQVRDLRHGLDYLETRDDIDAGRLAVVGVSFGGGHATQLAAIDDRVRAGVSIFGVGDGRRWMRGMRREYEWRQLLARLAEHSRVRARTGESELVDPTEEIMVASPERKALKGASSMVRTPLDCARAIIDYRPALVAGDIAPRAMLWMCMAGDPVVPAEHSRLMYEAAGDPRRLVVFPGDFHYEGYAAHEAAIAEELLGWLARHAGPGAAVTRAGTA